MITTAAIVVVVNTVVIVAKEILVLTTVGVDVLLPFFVFHNASIVINIVML